MARKKAAKPEQKNKSSVVGTGILDYFRFGDSYTSLVLGIIVVILAVVLVAALFRNRNFSGLGTNTPVQDISSTSTGPKDSEGTTGEKDIYIVKQGDTLWSIAEGKYNNGYRWVEIAKLNNLASADVILVGTNLTLPEAEIAAKPSEASKSPSLSPSPQSSNIQGDIYQVVPGDTLWDISLKAYVTGYRWPEIARLNNISNPNLIYSGTTLKLPKM